MSAGRFSKFLQTTQNFDSFYKFCRLDCIGYTTKLNSHLSQCWSNPDDFAEAAI